MIIYAACFQSTFSEEHLWVAASVYLNVMVSVKYAEETWQNAYIETTFSNIKMKLCWLRKRWYN